MNPDGPAVWVPLLTLQCAQWLHRAVADVILCVYARPNHVVVLARDGKSILRVLLTDSDVQGYHGLTVSPSGVVAMADYSKTRLVVCSLGGVWKRTIDAGAIGVALSSTYGVAFDAQERLWTCDMRGKAFVVIEA